MPISGMIGPSGILKLRGAFGIFRLNTVLRLYMHACGKRGNAGTNIGLSVYNHDAVGTSADGTKYAARFVFFCGIAVNHHAVYF